MSLGNYILRLAIHYADIFESLENVYYQDATLDSKIFQFDLLILCINNYNNVITDISRTAHALISYIN